MVAKGLSKPLHMPSPLPKYPAYKDSGVEWLGAVPEHWEVEKGIRYFYETESRSTTGDEELLSVSHLTGVTPRREKTSRCSWRRATKAPSSAKLVTLP